ncbi:hypothetical protein [Bradyrhizobium yuanmingense]|uniref:hypothetical protein n=1 Tax=Bradyrhizobium yuanmingense TaxID=108015 RepID=UPI001428AE9A|nr:hypothetical protein [Bradyrhizobium yuanmingense]
MLEALGLCAEIEQHDPEADQRDDEEDEGALDRRAQKRDQCREGEADAEDGGERQGRKIDDEDRGKKRELEEGIFLQTRRAEIEREHGKHRDAHRRARVIHQPAIELRQQRCPCPHRFPCGRAQDGQRERHEHERECRERIGRQHRRLAVTEAGLGHEVARQQQQRRIGLHETDGMLAGNLSCDREQPAREQIWIE